MKFPTFPDELRNPYLYQGLVEDIADRERDYDTNHPEKVDLYSQQLGRLCLNIAENTPTEPWSDTIAYSGGVADKVQSTEGEIYNQLRTMAIYAFDRQKTHGAQQSLHYAVMNRINTLRKGRIDVHKTGELAEYVTLALLTRYAHPDMLGYKSLQHHELDVDSPGHYDVGTLIRDPGNTIASYRLQVKLGCVSLCETGTGDDDTLRQHQSRYRPSVQIISGCCHLKEFGQGQDVRKLARQLAAERDNTLDTVGVKKLDTATDNLVWAMTTDQLPRGLYGGKSIGLKAEQYLTLL